MKKSITPIGTPVGVDVHKRRCKKPQIGRPGRGRQHQRRQQRQNPRQGPHPKSGPRRDSR